MTDTTKKIMELQMRRLPLLESLAKASKAAAAQMKDAGMAAGSAPLLELIFELEANEQQRTDAIKSASAEEAVNTLSDMLRIMAGPK